MKYDKVRAKTVAECMMRLRSAYGSSAIILATREIREGGLWGLELFSKKLYEVEFMVPESSSLASAALPTARLGAQIGQRRHLSTSARKESSSPSSRQQISHKKGDLAKGDLTKGNLAKRGEEVLRLLMEGKRRPADAIDAIANAELSRDPNRDLGRDPSGGPNRGPSRRDAGQSNRIAGRREEGGIGANSLQNGAATKRSWDTLPEKIGEGVYDEEEPALQRMGGVSERSSEAPEQQPLSDRGSLPDRGIYQDREVGLGSRQFGEMHRNLVRIGEQMIYAQMSPFFSNRFLLELDNSLSNREKDEYQQVRERALAQLASLIHAAPGIAPAAGECRATLLMGPAGVGKTTSIAKLAARFQMMEKREVSIYSLDHFRLAATEQLKMYAGVMEASFHAPVSREEFAEQLRRDGAELMLIDASGASYQEESRLQQLRDYVSICEREVRVERHLVLSANTNTAVLERILLAYDQVGFDKIILTKVDESDFVGAFVENADRFSRPFSFLMNGQNVPGDILEAKPMEMAQMVLGDSATLLR